MAKIDRAVQIKLNQLFKKSSIWSLTYQQSVFKRYHSEKHFSEFLPTRRRQKSTGIDMELNYVSHAMCSIDNSLNSTMNVPRHRKEKCVDTIGTVLVPWAGHFQC